MCAKKDEKHSTLLHDTSNVSSYYHIYTKLLLHLTTWIIGWRLDLLLVTLHYYSILADKKNTTETQAEKDNSAEKPLASTTELREDRQRDQEVQKAVADDQPIGNKADKTSVDDSGSDGVDVQEERPMSPGTLALMCDEPYTMFTGNESTDGVLGGGQNRPHQLQLDQDMSEVYVEQERVILSALRDCLRRIITCGRIKGKLTHVSLFLKQLNLSNK